MQTQRKTFKFLQNTQFKAPPQDPSWTSLVESPVKSKREWMCLMLLCFFKCPSLRRHQRHVECMSVPKNVLMERLRQIWRKTVIFLLFQYLWRNCPQHGASSLRACFLICLLVSCIPVLYEQAFWLQSACSPNFPSTAHMLVYHSLSMFILTM